MLIEMPCKGSLEIGMPVYVDDEGYTTSHFSGFGDIVGWVVAQGGNSNTVTIHTGEREFNTGKREFLDVSSSVTSKGKSSSVNQGRYKTCPYCGRIHARGQLKCWDGVDGCGASLGE